VIKDDHVQNPTKDIGTSLQDTISAESENISGALFNQIIVRDD